MKLYELAQAYCQIQDMINDDVDKELIIQTLNNLEEEIEKKAENIAKLLKSIEADIEALSNEEKRLQTKRRTLENNKEHLKAYLQQQLESVGKTKLKTTLFSFNIQNNPASVEISDESLIPKEFVSYEPKYDKKAILKLLKEGKKVPGCQLKETQSLRIR